MRRILKVLGLVFFVFVLGFAGMLVWAHTSGAAVQKRFFEVVATGDVAKVRALMNEGLKRELDEPVLAAFLHAFNDRHGAFQGLNWTSCKTSSKTIEGRTVTTSSGTVSFEKGAARSELMTCDGLFVKFNVRSDLLGDDWFPAELDTALYQARGKEFLEALLTGRVADAHGMTHARFQEKLPLEKFEADMKATLADVGKLRSVEYASEQLTPGKSPKLKVRYRVVTEAGRTTPAVVFQFVGLKGHLVLFSLNATE